MTSYISEDNVEQNALDELDHLGYQVYRSPNYTDPNPTIDKERNCNHHKTILTDRLRKALVRISGSKYSKDVYNNAIRQMRLLADSPNIMTNNHRMHQLLINGIKVPYSVQGESRTHLLYPIDFNNIDNNDFVATDQFTVTQGQVTRRPDITLFINGLPLVTFELKNPISKSADIQKAYEQLQTYKSSISDYMKYNEILIISDDEKAQAGSMTAGFDRFMPWRAPRHHQKYNANSSQLTVLINYMLNKKTLLNLIDNFIIFETDGDKTNKILAAYHQYYMVNKVVKRARKVLNDPKENKIGTVWHTQGSGKSLSMVFFTQIITKESNPTIVLLNDRNDLDEQLDSTFAAASEYLRQTPHHAETRDDMRKLLSAKSGGIIFTTIQKFAPEQDEDHMPTLTSRHNVIIIADEAHRSEYGLSAKFSGHKGLRYGYARYMRDSMPNASFIGFTGTPIDETGKSTKAVFGNYISIYDMTQAIKDHMTVKIYYESRVIPLSMSKSAESKYKKLISQSGVTSSGLNDNEKRKQKLTQLKSIAGAQPRINKIAKDFVHHFEARYHHEHGKAIFVAISRRNAVRLYNAIVKLRPQWDSPDLDKGTIKIVMTSASSDGPEMQKHRTTKQQREMLQKRMKDPNDSLKIVIVVSMWLTGFDAPDVNTMYIDKPMHGHNLMQAIARINRVFKDKTGALVVDYIGIADSLKNALQYYSPSDRKQEGINVSEAIDIMMEKYHIINDFLYKFDYSGFESKNANVRLKTLRETINYLLHKYRDHDLQTFCDTVTQLQKAYSLVPTSTQAHKISNKMAFFVEVKNCILKIKDPNTAGASQKRLNYRMRQLLDQSVIPGDPKDLYSELHMKRPNINMLSDKFLDKVGHMHERDLATSLLERLVKGQVRAVRRTNITQSEHFDEMLKEAIKKYNNRAITTEAVLNELIKLAKEINLKRKQGKKLDLSPEEKAFYDALAHHKEAVKVMGDKKLKKLAKALVKDIRKHADTDWTKRANLKAQMLLSVKHLLRRYGYPPDFSRDAQNRVLKQAEITARDDDDN